MAHYGAEPPPGALEVFLREDGVELSGGGAEKSCKCFNPNHDDQSPSMSINVAKGVYFCHTCEIGGNAYTYLTKFRNLPKEEACELLYGAGWTEDKIKLAEKYKRESTRGKGAKWRKDIPETWWDPKKNRITGIRIATHPYHTLDGELVGVKARMRPAQEGDKPPKTPPYRPANGGFYPKHPTSQEIPSEYRWKEKIPLYRVRELMARITDQEAKGNDPQIWIVEGEKCVDQVFEHGPPPVTCLYGGWETQFDKLDLEPLRGRKVLILADADDDGTGVKKALQVGHHLKRKFDCKVRASLPKEGKDGYDVAAAIGEGGWARCLEWIRHDCPPDELPAQPKAESLQDVRRDFEDDNGDLPPIDKNDHYTILGVADDMIAFRVAATMQIVSVSHTQMFHKGSFLKIAPLDFWELQCRGKEFSDNRRTVLADKMFRAAEARGVIDLTQAILGRGGFFEGGQPHYYLGGPKVLAPDEDGRLTKVIRLNDVAQILRPGAEIHITRNDQARRLAQDFAKTILEYRWEGADDGVVFLGWIVTSLIGGCLPFRPVVWLIAPPGSGKTFLLDPVLKLALGNAAWIAGGQTEAAIAAQMMDHSLPVCLDEFEPGQGRMQETFDAMMKLLRLSTSGGAQRGRGGAMRSQNAVPRFSVFAASVDQPNLKAADEQRVVTIRLKRKAPLTADQFKDLERRIRGVLEPEKAAAIRGCIIEHTGAILDMARELQDELNKDENITTRDSQIYGALSAGASFMLGGKGVLRPKRQTDAEEDEWKNFEVLMSTPMPYDAGRQMTLGEALEKLIRGEATGSLNDFCERHGVKWVGYAQMVYFAHRFNGLTLVLKRSESPNLNISRYLQGLPGIERDVGKPRFNGQQLRCLGLSLETLQEHGFFQREYEEGEE